eukprot:5811720-Pyramimonas_sp.AAC.1
MTARRQIAGPGPNRTHKHGPDESPSLDRLTAQRREVALGRGEIGALLDPRAVQRIGRRGSKSWFRYRAPCHA